MRTRAMVSHPVKASTVTNKVAANRMAAEEVALAMETEAAIVAVSEEAEAEEAATVIATEMTSRKTIRAGGDLAATRVAAATTSRPTNSLKPSTPATEA